MSMGFVARTLAAAAVWGLLAGSAAAQDVTPAGAPDPAVARAALRATVALPSEPASPPGPATLEDAQARISALEARIAELESALAGSPGQPAQAAPVPVSYAVDPSADEMRFLDLGVRRSYIGAERRRLVDQIHTMIPPIYEPAFSPFHGYTLPPRAFRVGIGSDRFINHDDFGRDEVYARFFDNLKVENQHVEAELAYGLDENDTLRVVAPLRSAIVSGTGQAFRIKPMVMSMNGQSFGVGDVQVMLKRKWFDQAYRPFNFATVTGVQLPTGRDDSRFNDAQTLVMNGMAMPVSSLSGGPKVDLFSDDLRLPNSAQPGTGSWAVMVGAMGTRQLTWNRARGAIHGGVLYKAFKDNGNGVRPGNEFVFAASWVRPPTASDRFTIDLTLLGRNKQSEQFPGLIMHPEPDENGMPIMDANGMIQMFVTPRPPFEHGTIVFASPSVVVVPKPSLRLSFSPMFRVYEPRRGPSPAFRLMFGITTLF